MSASSKSVSKCIQQNAGPDADGTDDGDTEEEDPSSSFGSLRSWFSIDDQDSETEENESESSDLAKYLFRQGMSFEQQGLMHDAIRSYHQSVHLMPDIEQRLFPSSSVRSGSSSASPIANRRNMHTPTDEFDDQEDLLPLFEPRTYRSGGDRQLCTKVQSQKTCHVSALPVEVMLEIFKWVVSSDMDVRALEQLSMVCAGFYVLARDPELWRLLCVRTWGVRVGILDEQYPCWRSMYLERTHVWHGGVYISKMTYVRHGESAYQDHFYRPWHLVVYYRYIRFFADGTVLMLTTPDEPTTIVPYLRTPFTRYPGALRGRYRLIGKDSVAGKVWRIKKPEHTDPMGMYGRRKSIQQTSGYDCAEASFTFDLRISPVRHRRNWQLVWLEYESQCRYKNGQETRSKFDLNEQSFPPFYFSRVKSYTLESENALR